MTEYSLTECAALLGVTHKTAARWLVKLEHGVRPYQPQAKLYTRQTLEAIAAKHGRTLLDNRPAGPNIAEASVARATLEELTRRVEALEALMAHQTSRSAGHIIRPAPARASLDPLVKPQEGSGLPGSARGNAAWVEMHGGPGASWVREWPGAGLWRTVEEAIAAVRSKPNWRDWTPTGWTPGKEEEAE